MGNICSAILGYIIMAYQYKSFIHNLIDWGRVEYRLSRYKHVQDMFPINSLREDKYTNAPPYYCHPVAYRLGVWNSEEQFRSFDALLAHAATIPGWKGRLNITQEYNSYYNFQWELQVAKLLSSISIDEIMWRRSGPDIEIKIDGQTLYLECYCYQKFYGKLLFLDDLLSRIDHRVHVKCAWALKATFPTNDREYSDLLELVLSQVTPSGIETLENRNEPYVYLILPKAVENVYVYFENENIPITYHKVAHVGAGDTDLSLTVALDEALKHKANANSLAQFHPNLVVINMNMSKNFMLGRDRAFDLKTPPPDVTLHPNIDGAVIHVNNPINLNAFDTVFHEGSLVEMLWQKMTGERYLHEINADVP